MGAKEEKMEDQDDFQWPILVTPPIEHQMIYRDSRAALRDATAARNRAETRRNATLRMGPGRTRHVAIYDRYPVTRWGVWKHLRQDWYNQGK